MQAIILAGGRGTRLRPYTYVLPKPLLPVGETPILELVIRQLASQNFSKVILAVNHQADLIQSYFGNGDKWNIEISYSCEDVPLGTMGPLRLITDLPHDFLVMNGDILTDLNFHNLFNAHIQSKNLFSVASSTRKQVNDYGVLSTKRNLLTGFEEKPTSVFQVSMGIYILNRRVVDYIPENTPFGFDNLMLALLAEKENIHVYEHRGYWLDIGRPDDYERAINEIDSLKDHLLHD